MTTSSRTPLTTIEINPDTKNIGTVIWLHGLGADGNDFVPVIPELGLTKTMSLRFVFPNAPMRAVTINNGYIMRAWYDIVSMNINSHADQAGIEQSVQQLQQLIENEINLGTPSEKIILAGFSQGALIALTTGLSYAKRLGGIMALSGYLPNPDDALQNASAANKNIPIFLGHGTDDTIVPFFLGEQLHRAMQKNGAQVSWHSYQMGHSVCMEEIKDIAEWLTRQYESPTHT